jgi:hypothetical protein
VFGAGKSFMISVWSYNLGSDYHFAPIIRCGSI